MNCCQCQGIEDVFNEPAVAKELEQYRRRGPDRTTRMLIAALKKEGVEGASLLDIGGGVGAIQHEMVRAGAQIVVDVDASQAYLHAAQKEAARQGIAGQIQFQHGNFVDLAAQIAPADIVTLDRVLCCYPDMERLVELSAERARKLYGLVYPRDTWWSRAALVILNLIYRLKKSSFRIYVHPAQKVEELVARYGFRRLYNQHTAIWQVIVYTRA